MKLQFLAFRNMVSKPLNLTLSLIFLSLSVSLITFVLQLTNQLNNQLDKNIAPFDMVVGAKGSPLQLVLSSVLHIDAPTGNISQKEIIFLKKHPFVKATIPVSYGDNYKGYRILGTEKEYLEYYNAILSEGVLFEKSFEVVIGKNVAERLELKIGDTFISSHGLIDSGDIDQAHEDYPYIVTGILKPTGTVLDQLLICNLESVWDSHDNHDHDDNHHEDGKHDDHDHDDDHHEDNEEHNHREITSLLVKFKNPLGSVQLPRFINENTSMQAALPGFEIQRLMGFLGSGAKTINGIAIAILLVSGLSIFISLLKTIRERRQELALLRTYGFSTSQLLSLVLLEGLFLAFVGFIVGWILGRLGILGTSQYLQVTYGYGLSLNMPETKEFLLLIIILVLSMIAT